MRKLSKNKISVRDQMFQKSILCLPHSWLEEHQLLVMHAPQYALSGQWRPEIYDTQRRIFYSLVMAYTNDHKNVHNKPSRIMVKEYHLTSGLILLPACGDKLAQLLREFFQISELDEKSTLLGHLVGHLRGMDVASEIKSVVTKYLDAEDRKAAYEMANKIKHRWSQHYSGVKTKVSEHIVKDKKGNIVGASFGTAPVSEGILYRDISILKSANNLFVECAEGIDKIINFGQFHQTKV